MKINQVAALTGVTVRTLHYYDKIGLLKPSQVTEAGYRLYDDAALGKLQQILKGEMDMSFQEFDMTDIETAKSRYSAEVKRRWGTTDAYKES